MHSRLLLSLIAFAPALTFALSNGGSPVRRQYVTALPPSSCMDVHCSSGLDAIALGGIDECGTSDTNCICYYFDTLSSGCTSCVVSDSTYAGFQSTCNGLGFKPAGPTGTAASMPASTVSGALATASSTSCFSTCSGGQDPNALLEITQCTPGDTDCTCGLLDYLSTDCTNCLATDATFGKIVSQCGMSSSGGASGPTATGSASSPASPTTAAASSSAAGGGSVPNSSTPASSPSATAKSGAVGGYSLAGESTIAGLLLAMAAAVFA